MCLLSKKNRKKANKSHELFVIVRFSIKVEKYAKTHTTHTHK